MEDARWRTFLRWLSDSGLLTAKACQLMSTLDSSQTSSHKPINVSIDLRMDHALSGPNVSR